MKILDVERLKDPSVDPLLRNFLITVYNEDTVRRLKTAFPEYFTAETQLHNKVYRAWLAQRDTAHKDYGCSPVEICEWFGLQCVLFEYRSDGSPPPEIDFELLPHDFTLERDDTYNGYEDEPWLITFPHKGSSIPEEFLVLGINIAGDEITKYFLYTIPTRCVIMKAPEDAES